jgi:integrase
MAKIIKPLSPLQVKNAKGKDKLYKLADGGGLYLAVFPTGSKLWRMKHRQAEGQETILSFGKFPDVSLEQARAKREEARKQKASGIDPAINRKAQKATRQERAANSFELVAREWYVKQLPNWVAAHADRVLRRLEVDVFPKIGAKPVADVTAPDYLAVFRKIEERGALETAHRVKSICGQIVRYAIATGRTESDPTTALRGALPPAKTTHLSAITDPKQVAELLRMIDGYTGTFIVACALKISPYVFVRPGELRTAEWTDIDLEAAEWRYIVTKTNTQHIVPLAKQAVAILQELHALTGRDRYVFPSARTGERPMSDNAILAAMRRMGIAKEEMTGHGFRAMARTILDEVLGIRPDLIEHQLAHAVKDPNGRAYNRTAHLPERKKMMQLWADYLDKIKAGADVVSLREHAA